MAQYVNLPNYTPSLGEALRNRYDDGVGTGWNALGAALMGGGGQRSDPQFEAKNYMLGQRMREGDLDISAKLDAERERRAQEYAQRSYQQDFADAIKNNDTARIIALQQRLKYNPEQGVLALGNLQKQSVLRSAYDAMMRGDDQTGNRALAVYDGKPMQVTKVADNVSFNPYAPSAGQSFTPTSIGQAMTTEKNAQATASNALAAKRGMGVGMPAGVVQDATGTHGTLKDGTVINFTPDTPPDVISAALNLAQKPAVKPTTLTKDEAARLFPDDQDYRNFQQFRYQGIQNGHPEYANADHAAMAYADAHKFDDVDSTLGAPAPAPSMLGRVLGAFSGSSSAPQAAPQPAPAQVAASPYKEGQKLRGPDGKMYVVQGGQPVPL